MAMEILEIDWNKPSWNLSFDKKHVVCVQHRRPATTNALALQASGRQ